MSITTVKPVKKRFTKYPSIFDARKEQIDYTEGQRQALELVEAFLESDDTFFLLAGYSGCGKTTIAENIGSYTSADILAPTNAAVNRLRDKINNSRLSYATIHKVLFSPKDDDGNFKKDKAFTYEHVYIIDEASMIDKFILDYVVKNAVVKKCKIIFMGETCPC